MKLTTERLLIRPMRLSDAAPAHALGIAPGVALPAGYPTPKTFEASRARVARSVNEWRKKVPKRLNFTIVRRDDGAWIGLININWAHPGVAELGYSLHPRHWGNGYATEAARAVVELAFEKYGAHRVQGTCWVKNARSAAVLKNAGLRKEGTLRGYLKRGRLVRDEFIFGLVRADRKHEPRKCAAVGARPRGPEAFD